MSYLCASLHCESNISFFKSWGIVCTITCNCNYISQLLKSSHHNILIIWPGPSQHLQLLPHILHILHISHTLISCILAHHQNPLSRLLTH